jgi:hypothetical protein
MVIVNVPDRQSSRGATSAAAGGSRQTVLCSFSACPYARRQDQRVEAHTVTCSAPVRCARQYHSRSLPHMQVSLRRFGGTPHLSRAGEMPTRERREKESNLQGIAARPPSLAKRWLPSPIGLLPPSGSVAHFPVPSRSRSASSLVGQRHVRFAGRV